MNMRSEIEKKGAADLASPAVGVVSPQEASDLVQKGLATLLDMRTVEELAYVGRVPGALHVAWATAMTRNAHFARRVAAKLPKDTPLLPLCRSGKRSVAAAEALRREGFSRVFNNDRGFEGNLDAEGHRGFSDGWCHHGLPWQQD